MLVYENDGKEKHQSITLWDDASVFPDTVFGYGATVEEAMDDYMEKMQEHVDEINRHFAAAKHATHVRRVAMGGMLYDQAPTPLNEEVITWRKREQQN